MDLEHALHNGAANLLADNCSTTASGVTYSQYLEWKLEIKHRTQGVRNGVTPEQAAAARKQLLDCEKESWFGGPPIFGDWFRGEGKKKFDDPYCVDLRRVVKQFDAWFADLKSCGQGDSVCIDAKKKVTAYESEEQDRALLFDRVAWQIAHGLAHAHGPTANATIHK